MERLTKKYAITSNKHFDCSDVKEALNRYLNNEFYIYDVERCDE